ncbi:MAG TPA: PQQ-binding-like beta-propeller repeat protein [Vicinamibacteria bacterium]|nr:PQQ-binding-like beta-propeller repeat protein [Vicinamibacteria bacterium]
MTSETLEDHLRRTTRNFTARMPEDQALALGRDLARALAAAHAEDPPRHPALEPSAIAWVDGKPQLGPSAAGGDNGEDLFQLGALVHWMATSQRPEPSWRLDGPPDAALSSLTRRAVLSALATPVRAERFATAAEAADALAGALEAQPQGAPPWPLFRGDASRSGGRPSADAASLTRLWNARLGAIAASPVVSPTLVLCPTTDGRLVFIDRANGRRVHETRVGSAVESTPALDGDTAHVGNDDGELVGLDTRTGEPRYRLKLGQLVRSSPLPADGRVFVGVVDGKTGALVATDGAGKVVWTRKLGAVFSSPALAGDLVLIGSDDGSLHALDRAKGTVAWSFAVGGKVRATPAVGGDRAIVGGFDGRVVAIGVKDGQPLWTRELGHALYSSPCIAGDLCVMGCHEGHLHGLDLATGAPRFEAATRGPVISSPSAVGGTFLAGSTDGDLYLLDGTGRVLGHATLSHRGVPSSPALDGDRVYVGSGDGLHALALAR